MNESNPQNRSLKTAGVPAKDESPDPSEVWATIKLDYQMPGEFATDVYGHNYLEGDLNRPRWRQASAFAHSLSRLIEQSFNLDDGTVQCRMRLVQIRRQELQPQINFLVSGMPCPNKQKLKSVSKLFSEEVCSQRNFKGSNDEEGSALSSGDPVASQRI